MIQTQPEALNLEEFRAKVTRAAREPLLVRIAELEEINTQLCEQADVAAAAYADLQAQLVKEAARTAEEKLRADQMSKQHDMQAKMHQEAVRKLTTNPVAAVQGFRDGAAKEQQAEWQPIETAPKDSSYVLLAGKYRNDVASGYWLQSAYAGNGAWIWPFVHKHPTHWMPLPAAPGPSDGESNG